MIHYLVMTKLNGELSCLIDRFENGHAVLNFGSHGSITIAKRHIPRYAKEGETLIIEFLTKESATKRKDNIARAILEEILNSK